MAHWLLKTDPETYSFDDLLRDKTTAWDGIRNYQACNSLAAMKVGDDCLIYHSSWLQTIGPSSKQTWPSSTTGAA